MNMCTYKSKKLIFGDEHKTLSGEYIMVCNGNNDFSIYEKPEYDKVYAIICSTDSDETKRMRRLILTKTELVSINNHKLKLPKMFEHFVYAEKFDVVQKNNHIRLLGHFEDYGSYDDKDLIEKMIEHNERVD